MDKNILEEYQNRVENVRKTLEDNREIVEEGVEASQIRTENRLEELQGMLEEAQRPIDMSDVGIGATGSFVRDSRASTIKDYYSDDREGYLLSEYDKRRVDPDESTANVENVVEQIRQLREETRMAREEAIRAEMQEVIEEQHRIEDVRTAQAEKAQLAIALQEEIDRIGAEVKEKFAIIDEKTRTGSAALEEVEVHKKTLALYPNKDSKVYSVAKGEIKRCREKARRARVKIEELNAEIASLSDDAIKLDDLLYEVDGRREEVERMQREADERARQEEQERQEQEDEMWRAHESEKIVDEITKESDIECEIARYNLEQTRAEQREQSATEKEIEQYADGLNPEEDYSKYDTWKPSTPIKPEEPQKPEETKPQKPSGQLQKQEPKQKPTTQDKWKVESVTFTIEGGSKPVYKVLVSNGKEQKEVISDKVAVLDISKDKEEIANLTNKQKIQGAEKYYDKGVAIALQEADKEYGTNSFEEYKQLLRDKEMINRYPERYENCLKINYDFSNLLVKLDENMKKLQKIAQASRKKAIVSKYKKTPNFLVRLIKKLFTKEIPETTMPEEPSGRVQEEQDDVEESIEEYLKDGREEVSASRMMTDWEEMHGEPGFDIEAFVVGLPETEADKYRDLQEQYENSVRENPYKGFRDRMRKEAKTGERDSDREEKEDQEEREEEIDDPFIDL